MNGLGWPGLEQTRPRGDRHQHTRKAFADMARHPYLSEDASRFSEAWMDVGSVARSEVTRSRGRRVRDAETRYATPVQCDRYAALAMGSSASTSPVEEISTSQSQPFFETCSTLRHRFETGGIRNRIVRRMAPCWTASTSTSM